MVSEVTSACVTIPSTRTQNSSQSKGTTGRLRVRMGSGNNGQGSRTPGGWRIAFPGLSGSPPREIHCNRSITNNTGNLLHHHKQRRLPPARVCTDSFNAGGIVFGVDRATPISSGCNVINATDGTLVKEFVPHRHRRSFAVKESLFGAAIRHRGAVSAWLHLLCR